jgi:hypothetical protein
VRAAINESGQVTERDLEEDLGIPRTVVSEILTVDHGKKRAAAKFVPRLQSLEQKEFRAEVDQDLVETANKNPDFHKNIITGHESCVYSYDAETKAQSSQSKSPESPCPKNARPNRSNVKAMMTVCLS